MASNRVKLTCSDNTTVEADVEVEMESETVKDIIEAKGINEPIPMPPRMSGATLTKVMEYCKYHVESRKTSDGKPATPEDEIKAWDANFVDVDRQTLIHRIQAAQELKINNLLILTTQAFFDIYRYSFGTQATFKLFNMWFKFEPDFLQAFEEYFRKFGTEDAEEIPGASEISK